MIWTNRTMHRLTKCGYNRHMISMTINSKNKEGGIVFRKVQGRLPIRKCINLKGNILKIFTNVPCCGRIY